MICKKCGINPSRINHVTCQICFLDIKVDDQFELVLPNPLPDYVNDIWKNHLLVNDRVIVNVREMPRELMFVAGKPFMFVTARVLFSCSVTHAKNTTILVDWLHPIQITCNCSLDVILKTGCKNNNHV